MPAFGAATFLAAFALLVAGAFFTLLVAAAFFVDGGDGGGAECVQKTHASLTKWYGKNASHVLMVKLNPGKSPAFEEYVPPTPS